LKEVRFGDCDFSMGRIDEDPDNGREIQQGDKDWHPILMWIGVVTG
jgi:hypothetical protein